MSEDQDIDLNIDVDVVVVGGGMAGSTFAVGLARYGFSVALVEKGDPAVQQTDEFDGRCSALAQASVRMLKVFDLWPSLADEAEPILDIRVSDGRLGGPTSSFFLHFDHREIGDGPMGHMVENQRYYRVLGQAVAANDGITRFAPCEISTVERDAGGCRVTLSDGRSINARLLVAADGRQSKMREMAGIGVIGWGYGQTGIVTTVQHEAPHHGVAQEHFLPGGPFAILPLRHNRSSLVWTERSAAAARYLALGEEAFNEEIALRFGDYLGAVKAVGPRFDYPLSLQMATHYTGCRLALLGDAAHGIHPIAGQGFNLGLRDVAAMTELLVEARRLGLDIGAPGVLADYQRWRRFDSLSLALVTDGLNRLFSNDIAPLRLLRDVGMGMVQRTPSLRRFFMRHASGNSGHLPRLLLGEQL